MARGWDSKSVEEQIEQSHNEPVAAKEPPSAEDAARKRRRQGVELSRKRVQHQLEKAENPAYQKMLRDTLAELDKQLAKMK